MAGTALAAGVLTLAATLSLGLAAVGGAAVTAQRAAGAADAASGAVPTVDDPCAIAARVAAASGAELVACAVDGLVATVQVRAMYAGLRAVSRARAGPPGT